MSVISLLVIACVIVSTVILFSGCTLLNSTSFNVLSQSVGDDNGFASLSVQFNTTGKIIVKVTGPTGVLYEEEFFKGVHDAIMHLDGYRQTPRGGAYFLRVFDENENMIFENEMTFAEPSLEIDAVELLWWEDGDTFAVVGAQVTAANRGDLPVYPYEIIVDLGSVEVTGKSLPMVVLPNQEKLVNACMYRSGVSAASQITETSVRSSDEAVLGQYSMDVKPEENVDELVFSWRYQGSQLMRVPELDFLYDYYVSLDRFLSEDYAAYIFDRYDDPYVELLTAELLERTTMVDVVGQVNFIASFAQDIRYATDDDSDPTCAEYPRFPIELLVDGKGDCEDKAILAAAILDEIGVEVALLRLPNHMAVGVHLPEDATSFEYYLDEYYFLETTRNRWVVGKVPDEYVGLTNTSAYPLTSRPILLHTWDDATRFTTSDGSDYVRVNIIVENIGSGAALNFEVQGAFYTTGNQSRNPGSVIVYGLNPGVKDEVRLELDVPQGITTILKTKVVLDGVVVHEKESTSTFP